MRWVVLCLGLVGCASLDSTMASWVGQPESELVAAWGAPDSAVRLEDRTVYTWIELQPTTLGPPRECRMNFTVAEQVVERWSYRGCTGW